MRSGLGHVAATDQDHRFAPGREDPQVGHVHRRWRRFHRRLEPVGGAGAHRTLDPDSDQELRHVFRFSAPPVHPQGDRPVHGMAQHHHRREQGVL
eukprot:9352473-Prorocentrum_lima.AAC.1